MYIVVAVVAHKHYDILPRTSILIIYIINGLVNHYLCLSLVARRDTSHSNVVFVRSQDVGSLAIIEQAEESVVDIAISVAERVFTLITEQEIVKRICRHVTDVHAIIPHAVTKEQQITRHLCLCLSPIVEHLHVSAVGIGIRCSRRKFIIKFVGRHHFHCH